MRNLRSGMALSRRDHIHKAAIAEWAGSGNRDVALLGPHHRICRFDDCHSPELNPVENVGAGFECRHVSGLA